MNENEPHGLIDLNVWSSVGGTVWEELEGVALLEEMCQRGKALRYQKPTVFQNYFLCFEVITQDMTSTALSSYIPALNHAPHHDGHGL